MVMSRRIKQLGLTPERLGLTPSPPPSLDLIEAGAGRVTSWSGWPLNFPFAPPPPGSDFAVTTPRPRGPYAGAASPHIRLFPHML